MTHPLLDRLRSATCGSRELDCLIHEWECPAHTVAMRGMYYGEPTGEYYEPEPDRPGGYLVAQAPHFTSSLDAALGLVERVLPGWRVQLFEDDDGWLARLKRGNPYGLVALDELPRLPTAPLAVLIALISAILERDKNGGDMA